MKTIFFVILATLIAGYLGGCVTNSFRNVLVKPDGTRSETSDTMISSAWPFGKVDTTAANMRTQFGAATMETGQTAAGLDNTAQGTALDLLVQAIIKAGVKAAIGAAPIAGAVP